MQKFPRFTFSANATIHYEWIDDVSPQTFIDIKTAVENGQWELVGGDYVESDVNLPNGESLIRQRLIGQRYYLKHFSKLADIAWMDDVFGFCPNLPQIIAKSGGKFFYTNKFCYSHYSIQFPEESPKYTGGEKFPFLHFRWQSPDGSEILCTWAQHKNNFHKHLQHFTKHSRTVKDSVDNKFDYSMNWKEIDNKCSNEVVPLIVNVYGLGDGGMGPRPLEILEQMVWEDLGYVQNGPIRNFFKLLVPYRDRLPIWKDELYLENHQGTLTSVGMIKENNHTAEILLNFAESLSVFSGALGGDHFQDEFEDNWKSVLFLQFHDVLPGSSICEVYRDAAEEYNLVFHHLASCIESSLMYIAQTQKSADKRPYYTIYNGLSWSRNGGYLILPRENYNLVLDDKKSPFLSQPISFTGNVKNRVIQLGMSDATGTNYLAKLNGFDELLEYEDQPKDKLLVYLPPSNPIGSFGILNISLAESAPREIKPLVSVSENADTILLTNNLLSVQINRITGRIINITMKSQTQSPSSGVSSPSISSSSPSSADSTLLGSEGIGYLLFQDDKTPFDAWNLDLNYRQKLVAFPEILEIKIEERGPLRASILLKFQKSAAGSTYHSRIWLLANDLKIYGELLVDWQEDHKLLKLGIDTRFSTSEVFCGVPYGIHKRSTQPKNTYQEAMIEYNFQQFAFLPGLQPIGDISGVAMYSQSKYGMVAIGGKMEMSLLKAPFFEKPDLRYATLDYDAPQSPIVDRGFHHIPWAIEFCTTSKKIEDILRSGYEYNQPLIALRSDYEHPSLSFMSISPSNVLLTQIKEIEAYMRDAPDWFYNPGMGEIGVILRCVEFLGQETLCQISINPKLNIKSVQEVDLLERVRNFDINPTDVIIDANTLKFTIRSYEIKSLLVVLRIPLE
jgi:alpha-mannosidase